MVPSTELPSETPTGGLISLDPGLLRLVRPLFAPVLILIAAGVAAGFPLPASLSGLTVLGPYVVLGIGMAISAWFNRGRVFVAFASLFAAYAGCRLVGDYIGGGFALRAVFTCSAVFVPLNIGIAVALPERGVSHHHNYRWLMIGAAELMLAGWIAAAGISPLSGTWWQRLFDHRLLSSPPMPIAGQLMLAAALIAAAARAWLEADATELRPIDVGLAGGLIAFFIACEWARAPGVFGAFMTAAGVILLLALLQESHRMAFLDPLTGLPGRRALEERLRGLGPAYTIAMVDVDHFKAFNDRHGHDVGDQVLKLVAARLAEIGGGGTAYRYGGEEFSVLFPNRRLADVLQSLEETRSRIEHYRMAVRGPGRPSDPEQGSQLRRRRNSENQLSVTVSMGVAERNPELISAAMVVRAADKALYRAKHSGRNRVSL